jgi:hypothetical protein
VARPDRHDLDQGPGNSVNDPEPGDATTPKTGKFFSKGFADGRVVEQVVQGGPDLALQVWMKAPDQSGHFVGDSQPTHRER